MFAICPPNFERLGNECYYFSTEKANWLDAQFQCLDRNSKLAEPGTKVNDRRLRKHLLGMSSSSNGECMASGAEMKGIVALLNFIDPVDLDYSLHSNGFVVIVLFCVVCECR